MGLGRRCLAWQLFLVRDSLFSSILLKSKAVHLPCKALVDERPAADYKCGGMFPWLSDEGCSSFGK